MKILVNVYDNTTTALKIGPNMVMIPLSAVNVLDGEADLVRILGTALTETAGQIAAAFKKFFNVATPTGTVNSIPDAVAGASGGLPTVNANNRVQAIVTRWLTDDAAGTPLALTAANLVQADAIKLNGAVPNNLAAGAQMDLVNAPNGVAVTAIQSGLATSANQTTILNRLGAFTGAGLNTVLGFLRAIMRKDAALTPSDVGGTFDNTTDSEEAISEAVAGLAPGGATVLNAEITEIHVT
jgi:hypothetical protein